MDHLHVSDFVRKNRPICFFVLLKSACSKRKKTKTKSRLTEIIEDVVQVEFSPLRGDEGNK